jgi:hypothetical protein
MRVKYVNWLYDSMQQSLWEANSWSTSQDIPQTLWNLNICCRVNKGSSLVRLLSQVNPVNRLPPYLIKKRSNSILLSTPMSSKWSLPFPTFLCIFHPSLERHMHHTYYRLRFNHPNNIWWRADIMKLFIIQFSSSFHYFLPLRPQHPILKHSQ